MMWCEIDWVKRSAEKNSPKQTQAKEAKARKCFVFSFGKTKNAQNPICIV